MILTTWVQKSPLLNRLVAHLQAPLYRNGYALVFSSAATSALGLLYWLLAARYYPTEVIGINAALLSAMTFLANLAQFNLANALNRFLPTAGQGAGRLILATYAVSVMLAGAVSWLFVTGAPHWAPTLRLLNTSPGLLLWFMIATMSWAIFVLQDSALVGLRQATWVPVENLAFALSKLGLLVLFASVWPTYGLFASWTLPVLATLLPVNWLIFRHLLPRFVQNQGAHVQPISARQVAHVAAGDSLSSLVWMATVDLLPILVLEWAGATANAYYYLAWTVAYALYLVSRNMGMSLIAEAATTPAHLTLYSWRILTETGKLLAALVVIALVGAPHLLRLFGPAYANEAVTLLQLLCLSALPNLVTTLHISVARAQRRVKPIVSTYVALCGLVLALTYLLLGRMGITGIGVAWLVAQSVVAAVLLATELRPVLLFGLATYQWQRWLTWPLAWRARHRHAYRASVLEQLAQRHEPLLTAALGSTPTPTLTTAPSSATPPQSGLVVRVLPTSNDLLVGILCGVPDATLRAGMAVLKSAQSAVATASLNHQVAVLTQLHADARLAPWRARLPQVLGQGTHRQQQFVVESLLPGQPASQWADDPQPSAPWLTTAAQAISDFHQRTATAHRVDEACLARWVFTPIKLLRQHCTAPSPALDRLAQELTQSLQGRTVAVGWVHGDFSPGNILMTPDGKAVTGLVDWEVAAADDLPQLDLLLLLLTRRMQLAQCELGTVVCGLLQAADWPAQERDLLQMAQLRLPGEALPLRALLLLCWLRHVAANLHKSVRYRRHWWWMTNNVDKVLQVL
jgi:O-antigen/teichoic acid export membrane protein/Ser/Thr protein kinase RdoA (MazF antagonist)